MTEEIKNIAVIGGGAWGTALADIDRVTHELSDLIERISDEALREAASANVVAIVGSSSTLR